MKAILNTISFKTVLSLVTILCPISIVLNCSSYLSTTNHSNETTSNLPVFTSCGKPIDYHSDTYNNLEMIFPIQKKVAQEYVANKLPQIEEYFSRNSNVMEKDTVKITIEYQSDNRVIISYLHQVTDSTTVTNDINSIIHASQSLDSNLIYSICIELSVVRNNTTVHAYIDDVNFSTIVGRSKENIMNAIANILPKMRSEYNRILIHYYRVNGKLTLKFIIDETGKVIYLKVIESTLNNCLLETTEINIVKDCLFEATSNKPNLTTVVYPFIFQ